MGNSQLSLYSWMSHAARMGRTAAAAEWPDEQFRSSIAGFDDKFRAFALERYAAYVAKFAAVKALKLANGGVKPQDTVYHNRPYQRAGVLPVSFVMEHVGQTVDTDFGVKARCGGWRLNMYAAKGVTCVKCGIVGTMFALERGSDPHCDRTYQKYHLNLYHVRANGKETMITVDHIIPKSRGGGDELANLQPMCFPCNTRKGNKLEKPCTDGIVAA